MSAGIARRDICDVVPHRDGLAAKMGNDTSQVIRRRTAVLRYLSDPGRRGEKLTHVYAVLKRDAHVELSRVGRKALELQDEDWRECRKSLAVAVASLQLAWGAIQRAIL